MRTGGKKKKRQTNQETIEKQIECAPKDPYQLAVHIISLHREKRAHFLFTLLLIARILILIAALDFPSSQGRVRGHRRLLNGSEQNGTAPNRRSGVGQCERSAT